MQREKLWSQLDFITALLTAEIQIYERIIIFFIKDLQLHVATWRRTTAAAERQLGLTPQ